MEKRNRSRMKILVINICKEKLHYFEFVRPIEKILESLEINFYTKHYTKFSDKDLKAEKIIICGTSLADKNYLKNMNLFEWINFYNKPILGICGGMQIISDYFKEELYEEKEIGLKEVTFQKNFLGFKGKLKAYMLHKIGVKINTEKFESYAYSNNLEITQAIKHKDKPFYGILFHPEVRNKKFIVNFCKI